MKRFLLTGLLLFATVARAGEREPATTASAGILSQRIEEGVKHADVGMNGEVQLIREDWSFEIETFQPFDRSDPVAGRLRAAYSWETGSRSRLEAFVTPHWSEQVQTGATRRTIEAGLAASWNSPTGWGVELSAAQEFRRRAQHVQLVLNYSMPLKNLGAYLDWSGRLGVIAADDFRPDAAGPAHRDSYLYYEASLRLPYRIGGRTTLLAGAHLSGTSSQDPGWSPVSARGRTRIWFELGLNVDF